MRFELIEDSGGAGRFRGGLGIRREYLNLEDARFSHPLDEARHPAERLRRRRDRPTGRDRDQSRRQGAKRLPTRYADYPLKAGDVFRLDTPGGGGHGDPLRARAGAGAADVREGYVSPEAAERDYGVVLKREGDDFVVDSAATQARRAKVTM